MITEMLEMEPMEPTQMQDIPDLKVANQSAQKTLDLRGVRVN